VLVVEHRANFASVPIYRRVKPRVLSKNAATHSLVADLHDVDLSCSRDSSVVRLTGASRWGQRRAVLQETQCRSKPCRYWPGVMPVLLQERSREIRLRRKVQWGSNIEQRLIPSCQKRFCALETVRADVPRCIPSTQMGRTSPHPERQQPRNKHAAFTDKAAV
jgi:hypothetical protein